MGYTEEDLAGLTDEERAALEEAEAEDKGAVAQDEDDQAEGNDKGAEPETKAEPEAAEPEAKKEDEPAQPDELEQPTKADPPEPAPLLVADLPSDVDAQLKEIADKKAELVDQFDNGDITAKEYQLQLDALAKQEREIELAKHKAELAREMQEQQRRNAWLAQVEEFTTKEHPEYRQNRYLWVALDQAVKEVAGDPKNAELSGYEILRLAHEQVLGSIVKQTKAEPKAEEQKHRPLKGSKSAPPPTLAKVPAAEPNAFDDGEFAVLDRLMVEDPEELEERLMRMSPEKRDAYLARA